MILRIKGDYLPRGCRVNRMTFVIDTDSVAYEVRTEFFIILGGN
jgi:hypothetical protein